MLSFYVAIVAAALLSIYRFVLQPLLFDVRAKIPGPKLFALTKWRLAFEDWRGERTRTIHKLHDRYGPVVRIGPNEVHFNSLSALQKIYGAGSGYERTSFYSMFDVYGRPNLFTFHSSKEHGARKKLLANIYSKSTILQPATSGMVEQRVQEYLDLIEGTRSKPIEMFSTLHYFSIDSIANFVYDAKQGGTTAVAGSSVDRRLLNDILDPARRSLSVFAIHFPLFTKWLYTRTNTMERLLRPLLPMQKPATYTGIRQHALKAFNDAKRSRQDSNQHSERPTVIRELLAQAEKAGLGDLDIASECADHLLAGIDTTADTLLFLFWALSQPKHQAIQEKLAAEVASARIHRTRGLVEASDKLPYLDAVIKETLRLYAPLPAAEPRMLPATDSTIDGYHIPAGTIVNMSPYSLHRDLEVFPEPLTFDPERWLTGDVQTRNRHFWAFSSGGRMCIGKHLAMAEMTSLVTAVYSRYTTALAPGFENKSPAITSRMELFYDETEPHHVVCLHIPPRDAHMLMVLTSITGARMSARVH
jgi:cytochrome P450